MKKLAIPAILAATIMVAGLFAFAPVEQASTVHQLQSGSSNSVLVLDKTLPVAGTVIDYTFTATTDSIIREIIMDNTDTVGDDSEFVICDINIGGSNFRKEMSTFSF